MTGLGTPVAGLVVSDLVAYRGSGTTYAGAKVGPLQNANLVATGTSASEPIDVFSVFDALTITIGGGRSTRDAGAAHAFDSAFGKATVPGQASRKATERGIEILGPPAVVSWGGMMPLETVAARDAVLTNQSLSLTAPGQAATLGGAEIRVRRLADPGPANRVVLDARSVDVLFGDPQGAGSLLKPLGAYHSTNKKNAPVIKDAHVFLEALGIGKRHRIT